MREYCESCDGKGYHEYPDYDWEENLLDEGIRVECGECQGHGYIDNDYKERNALGRMAIYILGLDIDEDICSKINCRDEDMDDYDCVDCIVNFFSEDCKWEQDEVCVNDQSDWCADFVDSVKCGRCKYFERPE